MPFRNARFSTRRWACALALLALLAQMLAAQLSTRHVSAMLFSSLLADQICATAGLTERTQTPFESETGLPAAAHCPVCAVTALSSVLPQLPALVPLQRPVELRQFVQAVHTPLFAAPAHLLPPAQGPPAG